MCISSPSAASAADRQLQLIEELMQCSRTLRSAGAMEQMQVSNEAAAQILLQHGASACTDVTGFGLLGHALEMARASQVRHGYVVDVSLSVCWSSKASALTGCYAACCTCCSGVLAVACFANSCLRCTSAYHHEVISSRTDACSSCLCTSLDGFMRLCSSAGAHGNTLHFSAHIGRRPGMLGPRRSFVVVCTKCSGEGADSGQRWRRSQLSSASGSTDRCAS